MPAEGPATRWGVLLSEVRPTDTPSGRGPRAVAELGTTLYLSRLAASSTHLDLEDMHVATAGGDSLLVSLRIRNPAERHGYVGGTVALKDTSGMVRSETLPTVVVLPGRTRMLQWRLPGTLLAGPYDLIATLDTGEPELIVGEVHLELPLVKPSWTSGDITH
jgi:hypothetical protein